MTEVQVDRYGDRHDELPQRLELTVTDRTAHIRLTGRADVLVAGDLYALLTMVVSQGVAVVELDLSDVEGVDAVAAEAVAELHRSLVAHGGRVAIRHASSPVADVLRRRGLAGLFR
jgi:anti-anti-sigma regulatory factor